MNKKNNTINYLKNNMDKKLSKVRYKKAISFIALTVTIIVILILVSAVILSLRKSRSVDSANEAALKSDLQAIKDNYEVKYNDLLYDNQGEKKKITEEDLKEVIPDKYKPDFIALPEGPAYIGNDEQIKEIAEELDYIIGYPTDRIEIDFVNLSSTINSITVEIGIKETQLSVKNIEYYISEDGKDWTKVDSTSFTNVFEDLKENESYKIKVVVIADNDEQTKSRVYTINTNTTDFVPGELILTKENADGEKYKSGSWTNKDVYIKLVEDGLDSTYEAYGANEVARGAKEDSLITKSGITHVRVTTKRDGVTKARDYEIKIDKYMPEIKSLVSNNVNPTNKNITLTGKAIDTLSGLVAYQFSKNENISEDSSGWETIEQTTNEVSIDKEIEENGKYYFYVKDAAGNVIKKEIEVNNIDKTPPSVESINVTSPESGPYKAGEVITITVKYSEDIEGTIPELIITFGNGAQRTTTPDKINGNTITYTYTIVDGDNGDISTVSYTGNISDLVGNSTEVTNKEIGGNKIVADTSNPSLSAINITSPESGIYKAGEVVTIVATYDENMKGTPPELRIKFGEGSSVSTVAGEIENNNITYTYTIANGDNGILSIDSYTGEISDLAGNTITVSPKEIGGNEIVADTNPPSINSINVTSPAEGAYNVGQSITIVTTFNEEIKGTAPVLKIKFGTGSERTATAGEISGRTITYTYTIVSGDNGAITTTSYTGSVSDLIGNVLNVSNVSIGGNAIVADTSNPTTTAPALSSNTNSITATFRQTDLYSGINGATRQYAIKKTSDSSWGAWVTVNDSSHTFTNLTMNTSYQVKTKVSDNVGNTIESEVATVSTLNITKPTLSAPTAWTNANVTVTISYPNIAGTTRQYSTDGSNWSNTSNTTQTVSVGTNNTTVYARVIDSTNQTSGNATHKVTNLDKRLPNEFTPTGEAEVNSVKITASTSDVSDTANGSSGIKNYQFSNNNGSSWTAAQTSNVYTFTGLTNNTTYNFKVKVTDNAGNVRVSNTAAIKTLLAVAKIDSTEYSSIQKAFNAAGSGKTVVLLQSTTESPTLGSDKNISFNMNNKTVTGTITSNGSIAASSGTVNGSFGFYGQNKNDSLTNVTINGRAPVGSSSLPGHPTVRISGGTISAEENNIIVNYGNLTLDSNPTVKNNDGTAVIYNEPGASVTIKNGTYSSATYACVKNFGTANIEGGSYTMTQSRTDGSYYGSLYNESGGVMNISNSPVINSASYGICNASGNKITITGTPQVTSTVRTVYNTSGTIDIYGGTYTSNTDYAFANLGTATIRGGTFNANSASGIALVGFGGTITVNNGTFKSNSTGRAAHNQGSATLNLNGGTYTATSNYALYNSEGIVNIAGGNYSSTNYSTVANDSTLRVTAGSISCTSSGGHAAIWNDANATISGGTTTSNVYTVVSNYASASTTFSGSAAINATGTLPPVYCISGSMNINSNAQIKYTGSETSIFAVINKGSMNMNAGTVTNANGHGIRIMDGTFHMYGGTVSCASNCYCLYKSGGTAVYHGGTAPRRNF